MGILLINPPNCGRSIPEERYGITSIKKIFRSEPLALEALAGNLYGHEVRIVDLKVEPEALESALKAFAPDLVGFTAVTCEAQTVLKLATTVKELSAARVVVGGVHAPCELCSSLLAESCTLTAATRLKIILSDTEREIIRKKQERSQIFIYK